MKTKMILGLSTLALLASTAVMAANAQDDMKDFRDAKGCKKEKKMQKSHFSKHHKFGFMHMVMKLNLDAEQKSKIESIIKDNMKNMPNPNEAFSDSKFDKDEFIKLSKQREDAKITQRAEMMQKVYEVLNSSQKKDLKTMLDMREIKQRDRF
jgi:Spy/CpxP family protein refolding chaperone